uniref:Uncharacterized protein n=1 Tax=viral metagenome TaxID=1070528 RepID=A0A6C0CG94_9ZZZZ
MLSKLDDTFRSYEPSARCWLDGDYIWTVLREHSGMLKEPILLNITHEHGHISGPLFGLNQVRAKSSPLLIRIKIDIVTSSDFRFKHSNLLAVYLSEGKTVRFEPVEEHEFTDEINELLAEYVDKLSKTLGINLSYSELSKHPQPNVDGECPNQGMCVAYVVKAGVDLALGRKVETLSSQDIKRFASAVEDLYG